MNLGDLYRHQSRRVERMLRRMLGSSADAADLAQETFLRAYVAELGERTELSSALLTVTARRLALNEIRNRTRRATDCVGEMDSLGVLSDDDPASAAENGELRTSLEAAIASMPPQCRQVFRMRKVEGLSHSEIAAALGISPKTVERHVAKGVAVCRARLAADGHAPENTAGAAGRWA